MLRLSVAAARLRRLLADIDSSDRRRHVLAVGGAGDLAPLLRQQFLRGRADTEAVRVGGPDGADAYVHVQAGEPGAEDVAVLRRARRGRVPAIAVAVGLPDRAASIPYVLATDVVWIDAGEEFPLDAIAVAVAARLGEDAAPLAAHVPLLRGPVCDRLVESLARRNALLGAAVWVRGTDLPVLVLNELRLVLRLAQANGVDGIRDLVPELTATLGAGLGLRALARELVDRFPETAWPLRVAIAYAGTRTIGEAARARFRPRASEAPASPATRLRAAAARVAP
jgi:hypothetical protein